MIWQWNAQANSLTSNIYRMATPADTPKLPPKFNNIWYRQHAAYSATAGFNWVTGVFAPLRIAKISVMANELKPDEVALGWCQAWSALAG